MKKILKKVFLILLCGMTNGVFAEVLDVKAMFGMNIYDSAEFSGSAATNAILSHPGRVAFFLHPWRNFKPSAADTQGSVLLSICGRSDPASGNDTRRDYEDACSYFDSCTNLKARAGALYNAESGRYWFATNGSGADIMVTASLQRGIAATGRVAVAEICIGEAKSVLQHRYRMIHRIRGCVERKGLDDGVLFSGVTSQWKGHSEEFREGCFDAIAKTCSALSSLTNICRYVRDPEGVERVTCTYLNFDGHDHRLDIRFPRTDDEIGRGEFEVTITDLNFAEPKVNGRFGNEARKNAELRVAVMRKEAGAKRMASGIYDCTWGYSVEFNIFVLSFDASGVGLAGIGLFGCPFTWKADREGNVVCELSLPVDAQLQKPLQKITVNLRYDPEQNAMYVMPYDGKNGAKPIIKLPDPGSPLRFMTKASGVRQRYDETMKRFEECRKRAQAIPYPRPASRRVRED